MSISVSASSAKRIPSVPRAGRSGLATGALSIAIYMHDLAGGGVERQSLIIAEEFRRHGADVTLVLHKLRGQLVDQVPSGLRVIDLNSSRTLMDVPRLAGFLRSEKPDILLSNVDINNIAALIAKGISMSSTKMVICQHNPVRSPMAAGEHWLYRHTAASYRMLSPLVSRAVAVSKGVADELHAFAGLPSDRVLTINNPVVGPDFEARSAVHVEHPWFHQPSGAVFITAGRLVGQKDHETMIRALALHRQNFDSRLIILGTGPLEARLRGLVASLDLTAAVDFLGFKTDALPYIRQADAFLLSSRCEGFGNVIVEAMACGTPVISSDCKYGPSEILDGGRFGVLVPLADAGALAHAMDDASTLRERFPSETLRQRAGEFSYAACASRYMAMFKALAPHRVWAA